MSVVKLKFLDWVNAGRHNPPRRGPSEEKPQAAIFGKLGENRAGSQQTGQESPRSYMERFPKSSKGFGIPASDLWKGRKCGPFGWRRRIREVEKYYWLVISCRNWARSGGATSETAQKEKPFWCQASKGYPCDSPAPFQ